MSDASSAEPLGQNLIKIISNACFSLFVFSVLIFTVIAITYQPPDPWLESSKALTRVFTDFENATFTQDNSITNTGEDIVSIAPSPLPLTFERIDQLENSQPNLTSNCDDASRPINCSDPRVLISIERFNLRVFSSINFLEYGKPAFGSKPNECDVAWKFRSKKEKSWRRYRDFRRFKLRIEENCTFKVVNAGRWHSGKNAKPGSVGRGLPGIPTGSSLTNATVTVIEEGINDTIPIVGSESSFRKGKYLYYSRGGDYCKGMNHYLWSFLCALGEAQYLNRTFVMDMSICLSGSYNPSKKDEEDKDFRYYFDLEHLKQSAKITEEGEFIKEWKGWDRTHKRNKIPVRRVASYKVTPMQLKKDKSTVIWRQFDGPEPENYWYRVCEGSTSKFVQRPWLDLWKSKRLMNIVSEISGRLDWDFDAVHVVRGEKAEKKELWPNLDGDTSPDALLEKLKQMIRPWRKLYIATNEPFYNYFDRLRSQFKIYLLDDFKELWAVNSEWYNETRLLNGGQPVEFDGYMRVAVDTEVLYRAKIRVETFNNLTRDCKDGINTC